MDTPPVASAVLDRLVRDPASRIHFVGIAGTGMSALAHLRAMAGGSTSGSDRTFDRNPSDPERARCLKLGIALYPQDGRGVTGASLVVYSTAVEADIPDLARARMEGVPMAHRSEWLAALVRSRRAIAVTGTSGKSTTVAMMFEALRAAGMDPGVVSGGDLACLRVDGARGNAWAGTGPLVVESDESDKSCALYEPTMTVLLNLQRDHHPEAEILEVFRTCVRRTKARVLLSPDPALDPLREGAVTFGDTSTSLHATSVELLPDGSRFFFAGIRVTLPVPGAHNVDNAVAALAVVAELGGDLRKAADGLSRFHGVARRFERLGSGNGFEVVDDFAHNAAKLAAAISTAALGPRRVVAFWQPHGYAPTRNFRKDLVDAFAASLRAGDVLFLPEIYFAGGTATKDISSADLCADLTARGIDARYLADRSLFVDAVRALPQAESLVLVMGARDPSLGDFARSVAAELTKN